MVLLLGDYENPLLKAVHTALLGRVDVIFLNHYTLVNELQVEDDIDRDGTAVIRWFVGQRKLPLADISGVLNELYYLPENSLLEYHPDDREYASSEHTAYLVFALNNFRNVLNPPSFGTLSGFSRSLPYQWFSVAKKYPILQTPFFHFGECIFLPEVIRNSYNCVVSSDIYDTKHWKTQYPINDQPKGSPRLYYIRPTGLAVFFALVKGEILGLNETFSQNQPGLDPQIESALVELCRDLSLDLATILLFHNEKTNDWTFGSISASIDVNIFPSNLLVKLIEKIAFQLTAPT